MDDMRLKFYTPVITGRPTTPPPTVAQGAANAEKSKSFQSYLSEKLDKTSDVTFSKHAVKRAVENNIDLTGESLARLNEGVRLAGEKNLEDPLILVGTTAFLVNIRNNTVITTVGTDEIRGNVFTNIDGTVII